MRVDSALELFDEIDTRFDQTDVLIMAAAVSDYRVANEADSKMKKMDDSGPVTIELTENPDILKTMGGKKKEQYLVGFAAETDHLEKYAMKKLKEKNLDVIVANEVGRSDRGFNADENQVILFTADGDRIDVPLTAKSEVANIIISKVIEDLNK